MKRLKLTIVCTIAATSGVALYDVFLVEPQSRLGAMLSWWSLPGLTFGITFALTLIETPHRILIPCSLLGGFVAAHAIVVISEWRAGANDGRWPLEFALLAVLTLPAFWATGLNTVPDKMSLKRQLLTDCFRAFLAGSVITALYLQWLLHSARYHGFASGALGPAYDIICQHVDPNCYGDPSHEFDVLAKVLVLNVLLYWLWISLGLCSMDAIRYGRFKHRLASARLRTE